MTNTALCLKDLHMAGDQQMLLTETTLFGEGLQLDPNMVVIQLRLL